MKVGSVQGSLAAAGFVLEINGEQGSVSSGDEHDVYGGWDGRVGGSILWGGQDSEDIRNLLD